jgi:hypothetical protein
VGCKLKRLIYWLKQASRSVGAEIFFLCFMWMIYCLQQMIMSSWLKLSVCCLPNFDLKDLGEASYVLGIQILHDITNGVLELPQKTYID